MTLISSRAGRPLAVALRYDAPNTVRVAKLNNDDLDRADPTDPDDNPAPLEDADATVEFTVFQNGRIEPFPDYDGVPLVWTEAVGDEPACYKASLPAIEDVPVGQYYGELLVTVPGYSPEPIRLIVTVFY